MKINIFVVITVSLMLLVLPAAASDNTLSIFGNANEDETIDLQDVEYTQRIVLGFNEQTQLADAKHDNRINMQDVTQIELIIHESEKELTLIDGADRIVTVKKPIERVVTLSSYPAEVMRIFRVQDKIVGIGSGIAEDDIYFPELSELPVVASGFDPDFEAILNQNPDFVIQGSYKAAKNAEKLPDVTVVGFSFYKPETLVEDVRKCSYIFGSREEAEEFIDWYEGYMNAIKELIKDIPEEDRPRIYLEATYSPDEKWKTGGSKSGWHQKIEIAGGNNIFGGISEGTIKVDPEKVIELNPEIIVRRIIKEECGYVIDDPTELIDVRDEIMNRPELTHVDAMEDEKVYIIHIDIFGGFNHLPGTVYFAKWFHPELFDDLDPQAIHQEYLTEFQGLDYDLNQHGIFVYPPLEES